MLQRRSDMYHVFSELVALTGLVIYINRKNRTLLSHIEDLIRRIETQEDTIANHKYIIEQFDTKINDMNIKINQMNRDHRKSIKDIYRHIDNEKNNEDRLSDTSSISEVLNTRKFVEVPPNNDKHDSTIKNMRQQQYSSSTNQKIDSAKLYKESTPEISCPFLPKKVTESFFDIKMNNKNPQSFTTFNFNRQPSIPQFVSSDKNFSSSKLKHDVLNSLISDIDVYKISDLKNKENEKKEVCQIYDLPSDKKNDKNSNETDNDDNIEEELKSELAELNTTENSNSQ